MTSPDRELLRRYLLQLKHRGVDRLYRLDGRRSSAAGPPSPSPEEESIPPARIEPGRDGAAAAAQPARSFHAKPSARSKVDQDSLFAEFSPLNEGNPTTRAILDARALAQVEALAAGCRRCRLCDERKSVVFGSGNTNAELLFVGEAPGRDEDEQGLPFVGRAGKLLTKIIESIDLTRDDVYIMNVLKCRPPGNRDPENDERDQCRPFLEKQIEFVDPKVICALGAHAARTLLDLKGASMRALREGIHYYGDIKVVPTYHPAALLRNPNWKSSVWEDMKKIRSILEKSMDSS